jgi:hypothetical protein
MHQFCMHPAKFFLTKVSVRKYFSIQNFEMPVEIPESTVDRDPCRLASFGNLEQLRKLYEDPP